MVLALAVTSDAGRTWTSADGEQTFEGEFIRYNATTREVTVRMADDARMVTFHADRLSKDDRGWVARVAEDPNRIKPIFTNDFEGRSWTKGFRGTNHGHIRIMNPGDEDFDAIDDRALRISIPRGSHTGTSLSVYFADHLREEPESAYFRYHIRLCDHWETLSGGKLPGFGGTYNRKGWGGKPTDGTHGWSARGLFIAYRDGGRSPRVPVGFYSYHADMRGQYGDNWRWHVDGWLTPGRWHLIEQQIHLNTPDQSDGVISAWVDGRRVYHNTSVRFRNNPSLKVERIWLNVYYGGKTPAEHDLHLDIDNLFVAIERP